MTGRLARRDIDVAGSDPMHYVYLLKLKNGDIYKGSTKDLRRRITEHEQGKVISTSAGRPFILIGYEAYLKKTDAERRERFLKTTEGRRLLQRQYRDMLAHTTENTLGGVA